MNHGLSQGIIDDSLLRRIYDNKDKVAAGSLGVAGPSLANASADNAEKGLLGSLGDAGLEANVRCKQGGCRWPKLFNGLTK